MSNNDKLYCPACNWAVSVKTVAEAAYDYKCPSCQVTNLSEFKTVGTALYATMLYHQKPKDGEIVLALVKDGQQDPAIYRDGMFARVADLKVVEPNAWRRLRSEYQDRMRGDYGNS